MKKINHKISLSIIALLIVGFYFCSKIALAESDDENDSEERNAPAQVISTAPADNTPQKAETKTIYTKLSDTISTTTTTIIRHDSDGDGIYDDEDPHPTINENFIVKDANLNGIDDRYEQLQ